MQYLQATYSLIHLFTYVPIYLFIYFSLTFYLLIYEFTVYAMTLSATLSRYHSK